MCGRRFLRSRPDAVELVADDGWTVGSGGVVRTNIRHDGLGTTSAGCWRDYDAERPGIRVSCFPAMSAMVGRDSAVLAIPDHGSGGIPGGVVSSLDGMETPPRRNSAFAGSAIQRDYPDNDSCNSSLSFLRPDSSGFAGFHSGFAFCENWLPCSISKDAAADASGNLSPVGDFSPAGGGAAGCPLAAVCDVDPPGRNETNTRLT